MVEEIEVIMVVEVVEGVTVIMGVEVVIRGSDELIADTVKVNMSIVVYNTKHQN